MTGLPIVLFFFKTSCLLSVLYQLSEKTEAHNQISPVRVGMWIANYRSSSHWVSCGHESNF